MALIGKFSETPFTDLIQFYTAGHQTVAVTVSLPDGQGDDGVFYVEDGDVVDAWLGEAVGREAIRRALRLSEGSFRVEPNIRAAERTITEPWRQILMEEAVQLDEERRQGRKGDSVEPGAPPAAVSQVVSESPAGARASGAAELEMASRDEATLDGGTTTADLSSLYGSAPRGTRRLGNSAVIALAGGATLLVVAAVAFFLFRSSLQRRPGIDFSNGVSVAAEGSSDSRSDEAGAKGTLTFGMVSPLNGANKELGLGIKAGIDALFAAVNDSGGVYGRRLELVALDDGNEPSRTAEGMRELIETRKVFAVLGNAGTATASAAVPWAVQKKVPLVGALTGPELRKQPPDRYVFVYRPSLAEETAAAVHYLVEIRHIAPAEIAVFSEDDEFGETGWKGAADKLQSYGRVPGKIIRTKYRRNSADVEEAVKRLRGVRDVKAVVMVSTDAPASRLIEKLSTSTSSIIFTGVSSIDVGALAEDLVASKVPIAGNVVITQVVPLPTSQAPGVVKYRAALEKFALGEEPGALSLEGWAVGTLVVEALKGAGAHADPERFVRALEKLQMDVGFGVRVGFSPSDHQASHKVWGTMLEPVGTWKQIELQ